LGRFDEFVHDVLRSGLVRVAHAEVDDVFATTTGRHLEFAHDVEHVGRQPLDAREFSGQGVYTTAEWWTNRGGRTLPARGSPVKRDFRRSLADFRGI